MVSPKVIGCQGQDPGRQGPDLDGPYPESKVRTLNPTNKSSPTLFILLRTECVRGFESASWIRRNQSFVDSKCGRFMDSGLWIRTWGVDNPLVCARSREDKREV
uniref:Uncharacterized protein n=1 Tax=Ananas comosus var. bracteatus TaxID=296719 RepID=A0A6V7P4W5_ANACO|nr:unnamed protein product [Ananas comosus var. bracteatus]